MSISKGCRGRNEVMDVNDSAWHGPWLLAFIISVLVFLHEKEAYTRWSLQTEPIPRL